MRKNPYLGIIVEADGDSGGTPSPRPTPTPTPKPPQKPTLSRL